MRTDELDYELPATSIAVAPAMPRDASRLMVVGRGAGGAGRGEAQHRHFRDMPAYLRKGDLLVVNQTRVVPAKLELKRQTRGSGRGGRAGAGAGGGIISGLFLHEVAAGEWEALLKTRGRVKQGEVLEAGGFRFELAERLGEGRWRLLVTPAQAAATVLERIGHVPLPPYIVRQRKATGAAEEAATDKEAYQTVYAAGASEGHESVAAPTAGLHFTPELLARLTEMGVERIGVELAVGMGTFLPVESPTLEEHVMHKEWYRVPAASMSALRQARKDGRRIIAVGTTAVRTLESAASEILGASEAREIVAETALMITPGYPFQMVDALITNFHLPRSTLLALVGAFLGEGGVERLKSLYQEAIEKGYRFYSYGDAMLIGA